jgi:hypothetical protein
VRLLRRRRPAPVVPSGCEHPMVTEVTDSYGHRVGWICADLDCLEAVDVAARAAELFPDASWPPIRRTRRLGCGT